MAEKNSRRNETTDALFDAILSLESREECYAFFEDLCTVKEISDMALAPAGRKVSAGRCHLRADRQGGGDQHCHHPAASTAASSTVPAATAIPLRR